MAERVVVHQNNKFETMYMVWDPESPEGTVLTTVEQIHVFTPYGLLLASLGACTAMVINTYAQNHKISLDEVEITLEYNRKFKDDCDQCEDNQDYNEAISEQIVLHGDLNEQDCDRLRSAAHLCPIDKILNKGIDISTYVSTVTEMRDKELKE